MEPKTQKLVNLRPWATFEIQDILTEKNLVLCLHTVNYSEWHFPNNKFYQSVRDITLFTRFATHGSSIGRLVFPFVLLTSYLPQVNTIHHIE